MPNNVFDRTELKRQPLFGQWDIDKAFSILKRIQASSNGKTIPFRCCFQEICRAMGMDKHGAWKLLFQLKAEGKIRLIFSKGIKILEGMS